jgi:ABC-2 type transport system ATP-binding protein
MIEVGHAAAEPEQVGGQAAPFALELWNVTKTWRGGAVPVLDDVDFQIEAGTAAWLVGRNGAGKTTLLRIAAGLIFPDSGMVWAQDLHPHRDRRAYQRAIGFLSAMNAGLYARVSVRRHLDLWGRLAGLGRDERAAAAERATADWDLTDLLDRRVDRLSMGQRQRVRLAGTFLHDPTVVLLDEPRNSLDDEGERMVHAAVQRVLDMGGAVLWAGPKGEAPPVQVTARYELEGSRLWEA